MRVVLADEPAAAGEARRAATGFAREQGAAAALTGDIALAVSEAVTKMLALSDGESRAAAVVLAAERDGDDLRVVVSHDGAPVTRGRAGPGFELGLAIIGQVSQSSEVRTRDAGGFEICMTFALAG
jgi:anti-sigma regulatory factor (Ser/Thr protein kinase)